MTKTINNLTADFVKSVLDYDPLTGELRWKKRFDFNKCDAFNTRFAGKLAGNIDQSTGYKKVYINGRHYYIHRIAWLIVTGKWPVHEIDHINCNKADNRWHNMREANHCENARNRGGDPRNITGIKGVHWRKRANRWTSSIRVNKKLIHLGYFNSPKEAHNAYRNAAEKFHKKFAHFG